MDSRVRGKDEEGALQATFVVTAGPGLEPVTPSPEPVTQVRRLRSGQAIEPESRKSQSCYAPYPVL